MPDFIGTMLDRYQITELIGQGGMATVYKAHDMGLKRYVAIKIIRRSAFSSEVLERVLKRFDREAELMARLTHPNIVYVIDYGKYEGSPYLVLQYMPGGTLKQRMGQPLPYQQAAQLLRPIADALAYAHQQGVIHRDVKPANILLTAGGQPMLSDFGIARLMEHEAGSTLTGTGMGVGTVEYMAPEQFRGKELDGRADVYALGVVLYEMVTGRKPYEADSIPDFIIKQATEPHPDPRQYVPGLPERVAQVLSTALARKPEERYRDILEFLAALEELSLAGAAVPALESAPWSAQPQPAPLAEEDSSGTYENEVTSDLGMPAAALVTPVLPGKIHAAQYPAVIPQPPSAPRVAEPLPGPAAGSPMALGQPAKRRWWLWVLGAALALAVLFVIAGLSVGPGAKFSLIPFGFSPPVPTDTPTSTAAAALAQTPTETFTPTTTSTPTPGIGSTQVSEKDGMLQVYVPAGEFLMGSLEGDSNADSIEKPQHKVYLDAFWIDRTEVTNTMYAQCVAEGICSPLGRIGSSTRYSYYGEAEYADYPVIYVNWNQANEYCAWAGRRLPTEAEWEKAARGTDGQTYPWGNSEPSCDLSNFNNCKGDTTAVGSYLSGASPYGALDMAGNVGEWVADMYSETYYQNSPLDNPQGPGSGNRRVIRGGGAWEGNWWNLRLAFRHKDTPESQGNALGFRCVR